MSQLDGKQIALDSLPFSRLKQSDLESVISASGQRVLQSDLPDFAGTVLVTDTAYFVYCGVARKALTLNRVKAMVTGAGSGTIVSELGIFSSPLPGGIQAGQTLTKLVSTNATDLFSTVGVKRNTTAFGLAVAAGTHLWAGIHVTASTTKPSVVGLSNDWNDGLILAKVTNGLFSAQATVAAALIAGAAGWQCPQVRITLDA